MKAEEARFIAKHKVTSDFRHHFEKVIQQIKINAELGNFSVNYYSNLPKDVEIHLMQEGYRIERKPDGRNGEDITISWA